MPDILDQIQQQQTRDENASLQQATADNTWAQTFNSIPPIEKLRAARNLTDQVNSAVQRRMEIAAEHDKNAQEIYANSQKLKAWQESEPKRAELLQARIDHENAMAGAIGTHEKHQLDLGTQTANETTAMLQGLPNVPGELGTPEHAAALTRFASQFPHAITTPLGREILAHHAAVHDTVAQMQARLPKEPLPAGQQVRIGADGKAQLTATSPNATTQGSLDDRNYWTTWQQAHKEASVLGRDYGVDVQYSPDGMPSIEATRKYAEGAGLTKGETVDHVPDAIQTTYSKLSAEQAKRNFLLSQVQDDETKKRLTQEIGEWGAAQDALVSQFPKLDPKRATQLQATPAVAQPSSAATPSSAAPVAPVERTATNPSTGEKMAFRNGSWVPLH